MKKQLFLILIIPLFGASVNAQQGYNLSMAASSIKDTKQSSDRYTFSKFKNSWATVEAAYEFENKTAVTISYTSYETDITTAFINENMQKNSPMPCSQSQVSAGMYTRKVFPSAEYLFAKFQGELMYRFGQEGSWYYGTQSGDDEAKPYDVAEGEFVYQFKLNPTYGLKVDISAGVDLKKLGTFEIGLSQIGGYHETNEICYMINDPWGTLHRGDIMDSPQNSFLYEFAYIARYTLNINRLLPKKKPIEADKLN